jgi:hypothetical protein
MKRKFTDKKENQRRPQARKYYIMSESFAHKLADFEIENIDGLLGDALTLDPPTGRRGFPVYPERPRVVIGKRKSGPPPSDIEPYHSYWLISDRLKSVFESVDPSAFAFQACDVKLSDGSPGPVYWLFDVVRILEAFGDKTLQEIREYREKTGFQYMGFLSRSADLSFNEAVADQIHVFLTPYSPSDIFCDQYLKAACEAAGAKGVKFHKCFRK